MDLVAVDGGLELGCIEAVAECSNGVDLGLILWCEVAVEIEFQVKGWWAAVRWNERRWSTEAALLTMRISCWWLREARCWLYLNRELS